MNEKLAQALDYIEDQKIADAAEARRKRHLFLKAVAAILAIVILMNINLPSISLRVNAKTISEASGSRSPERPERDDFASSDEYRAAFDNYLNSRDQREQIAITSLSGLNGFLAATSAGYMSNTTENRVYSPINAFLALAALAEVTGGESRQQILSATGISDMESLRTQVEALWETVYLDKGSEVCLLGNSLWLDSKYDYNQETMDNVAQYHYTSVFQKNLSRPGAGRALGTWVDNQTGGLLKSKTAKIEFPEKAVLTLVSTVYLQSKWSDQFKESKNTRDTFHAPSGDITATFMNTRDQGYYFWTEDYGASYRWLKNDCKMWFFLPDPDKSVDDVLKNGEYLEILTANNYTDEETDNSKYLYINWTVPKFDVSSSADLSESLKACGITDIFDLDTADFTAITGDTPVVVTGVNQSARVIIDEEGVKAASYIEIPGAGAAEPPEDEVDMVLDRPFVFVIATTEGIPLFTGVVIEP